MPTDYLDWQYYGCRDKVCQVVKNISNMRSKGLTCTIYISIFLQNLKYVGAIVTEFLFFNRTQKRRKNMDSL